MPFESVTIGPDRGALLRSALVTIVVPAAIGLLLQRAGILENSPLGALGRTTGLPMVALAGIALGVLIAVVLLKDGWKHRVVLGERDLVIRNELGTSRVSYENIAAAREVPSGAGITLKDPAAWMETFEGSASGRRKMAQLSALTTRAWGCEVAIAHKFLAVGPGQFVEQVRARAGLSAPASAPDPVAEVGTERTS